MAATIVWSSGGLIVRSVTADTWTIIFWRSVSSASFLILYLWISERRLPWQAFRASGWAAVAVGACFAAASMSFVLALGLTTVANALMLQATAPIIAGLLARVILGEPIEARTWTAIFVAVLGVGIMLGRVPSGTDLLGTLLAFSSAFFFSCAVVIVRSRPQVPMVPGGFLAAVFAAFVSLPLASPLDVPQGEWPLLIFFGAGQLGVGMALFTNGARHIPAATSSLISLVETALGPFWVWLVFGENPGAWVLSGGAVIVTALIVHTLAGRR
ncbi:MAG: DMT family transporter [Alphaproteobacteria bacterium]|nr:DMT family transporter [Alphaproteobacteria bacterium]